MGSPAASIDCARASRSALAARAMPNLRQRLATGAGWTLSIRALERVIGFISTLILARLLAPQDFGVVAMGTAIQEILTAVTAFGFTQGLIRLRRRDRSAYATAFTLHIVIGTVIATALLLSIPLALRWYGDPRVTTVLVVLALISFTAGLRNPGMVRYERSLKFRPFFIVALARKLTSFGVGAVCALAWGDYRALLAGMLLGQIVETLTTWRLTRFRPYLTLARARELLGFSTWWLGSRAATVASRRMQNPLIGQRMGAEPLGQYSVALDLATMVPAEIVAPVMRAMYPGYMLMKDEPGRVRSAFVRVWGIVALLTVPAAAGMAVLATPITDVVLGARWLPAAELIPLLAIIGAQQALIGCYWPPLLALVGPRTLFRLSMLELAISVPLFAVALWQLDLRAAIAAWIAALCLQLVVGMRMLLRRVGGSWKPVLATLWRPLAATLVMIVTLRAASGFIPVTVGPWPVRLAALLCVIGVGLLTYVATVCALWFVTGKPPVAAEAELLSLLKARIGRAGPA